MTIYLLIMLLMAFLGGGLVVVGFFKPVDQAQYEAAFRVNVDNLNRNTVFDVPELQLVLWPFLQLVRRLVPPGERQRILAHLLASGNPKAYSPDEYLTLCFLSGGAGAAILVVFESLMMDMKILSPASIAFLAIGFLAGYMVCRQLLAGRASRRIREIRIQLPNALDLLSMTMQAGATFYEASKTVVAENPDEPLNQELGIVVREIEFGRSRQEALQHFAERIPVDTLQSIIAAVLQAEQLGTPLAQVLLLQANLLRMYRSMTAEKTLGEATVKLLIPSMLIFLAAILVVFGPVLIRFMRGDLWQT